MTVPDVEHAGAADAAPLAAALDRLLEQLPPAERTYLRAVRQTLASPDHRDPASFCESLLAPLVADAALDFKKTAKSFFSRAIERRPESKLLPVLACHQMLAQGDLGAAFGWAKRAVNANPHDLHAQRLYRRCRSGSPEEPDLRGRFCSAPFDNIETQNAGQVFFCCPAWLPVPIGNLKTQSAGQIWNSPAAQEIRRSILDGSYRYCSRLHCPKLTADMLPRAQDVTDRRHAAIIAERKTCMGEGPRRVALNHDRSCNLSCPSCRTRKIVARKAEQDRLDDMAERVLLPLLRDARRAHITGSGDPFASSHFRHILKRLDRATYPRLKLSIQTNGLLLDRRAWPELGLSGLVDRLHVSIDAANAATYASVRRGGSFARLMENLAFIAELRRAAEICYVRLDFVVQQMNFREVPAVVELVERFGFDGLKLQMIRNWGTYSHEEFKRHHIGAQDHPEHEAFLRVLGDERLTRIPVEYWGFHGITVPRCTKNAAEGDDTA